MSELTIADDFIAFWKAFPRHVGKLAAERAYKKARTQASAQQILDGVEAYKHDKPGWAEWCYPKTFLTQGRWMDESDERPAVSTEWVCTHTPHCLGRHGCDILKVCGR